MRNIQVIKMDLKQARERFLDMMKNWDSALSADDISMGHSAYFYLNYVPLLENHIKYYRRELKQVLQHWGQTSLFLN